MSLILWTYVIAILTAVTCSLAGVYLVVKREAFVSEGLSHAVLPGIIFAFLIFRDRGSPMLVVAAGLSGLLMVWLTQAIVRTGRVKQDAALGIVFSGMFSIGVIASSLKLKNIHFHAHCIIDGNLAFATLDSFILRGIDFGPKAFVSMFGCLILLLSFVAVFYKELKLMAFDETASRLLGFRPKVLHTVWLALVSLVAVAAFETAGTILVVALMIAPPATAGLLTRRFVAMIFWSGGIAAVAAVIGVATSLKISIAPAGPIASAAGVLFLLAALFAPATGLFSKWIRNQKKRANLIRAIERQSRVES